VGCSSAHCTAIKLVTKATSYTPLLVPAVPRPVSIWPRSQRVEELRDVTLLGKDNTAVVTFMFPIVTVKIGSRGFPSLLTFFFFRFEYSFFPDLWVGCCSQTSTETDGMDKRSGGVGGRNVYLLSCTYLV
jgi:hypothetical protein